jgi:histidine ammonia-lyase
MPLTVGSAPLTLEDVERVARFRERVELAPEALVRIHACRRMLEEKIAGGEIMYGVNTGIGEFSEVALTEDQVRDFQKYLIFNHSAGIGGPVAEDDVRAAILSRVRVHSHGHSGCRPEITETLVAMLNAGITPVVCEKGSVGACGDLAPMSQVALCLLGEGEAFYGGERLRSSEAFERAGIGMDWPPSTARTS